MRIVALLCLVLIARPAAALPVPKPPGPAGLAEAVAAYKAVGGGFDRDGGSGDETYIFRTPRKLTAAIVAKLPDPAFDYHLVLPVGPDTPADAIRALGRLRRLRTVEFETVRGEAGFDAAPLVAALAAVPDLRILLLDSEHSDGLLTDATAARAADLRTLRRVGGSGPVTDAGLASIARLPHLETVYLRDCCAVTDAGFARLAGVPTLRRVLTVGPMTGLTPAGVRAFANDPRVTEMKVAADDAVAAALADIPTLETLDLSKSGRGPLTGAGLARLARLPRLRSLTVRPTTAVTGESLTALGSAPALERLWARDCPAATDDGLRGLARSRTLRSVSLSGAKRVTDAGVAALAGMPGLGEVTVCDAHGLTDAALRALAGSAAVSEVFLDGGTFTEDGLRAFVRARGWRLRSLTLYSPAVTDAVLADLAERCPDLEWLYLSGCTPVTGGCVESFARMRKLRFLVVYGSALTERDAAEVRRRLPDCPSVHITPRTVTPV